MENVFIISILCTFIFCLAKLCEAKFLQKEKEASAADDGDGTTTSAGGGGGKPLKHLLRDAVVVFGATVASTYLYFHVDTNVTNVLHILTETKTAPMKGASEIFTGNPEF